MISFVDTQRQYCIGACCSSVSNARQICGLAALIRDKSLKRFLREWNEKAKRKSTNNDTDEEMKNKQKWGSLRLLLRSNPISLPRHVVSPHLYLVISLSCQNSFRPKECLQMLCNRTHKKIKMPESQKGRSVCLARNFPQSPLAVTKAPRYWSKSFISLVLSFNNDDNDNMSAQSSKGKNSLVFSRQTLKIFFIYYLTWQNKKLLNNSLFTKRNAAESELQLL